MIVNNKNIESLRTTGTLFSDHCLYNADKELKSSNNSTVTTFIISSNLSCLINITPFLSKIPLNFVVLRGMSKQCTLYYFMYKVQYINNTTNKKNKITAPNGFHQNQYISCSPIFYISISFLNNVKIHF